MLLPVTVILVASIGFCHGQSMKMTPPVMLPVSNFDNKYFIGEDEKSTEVLLTLHCEASGSSDIKYTWYKLNEDDMQSDALQTTQSIQILNGEFKVIKTGNSVWGKFRCTASNQLGTAMSSAFEINRARLAGSFPENRVTVVANESSVLSLPCRDSPTCEPNALCKFEWRKGATGSEEEIKIDERIDVDNSDGSLHFLKVKLSDATTDKMAYGCGLWNKVIRSFKVGSLVELKVNPKSTTSTFIALRSSANVMARLHDSATLHCIFGGNPLPFVTWKYEDKETNPGESKQIEAREGSKYEHPKMENGIDNRRLIIHNVTEEDANLKYFCIGTGQNERGEEVKLSASVKLTVLGRPVFTDVDGQASGIQPVIAPKGSDAVFICKARGIPNEPSIYPLSFPTWYQNGNKITDEDLAKDKRYTFSEKKTKLTIKSAASTDMGTIACLVSNDVLGESLSGSFLAIIEKIQMIETPPSSAKILEGENVTFHVEAVGDPQYTMMYNWSLKNTKGKVYTQENFPKGITLTNQNREIMLNGKNLKGEEFLDIIGVYKVVLGYDPEQREYLVNVTTDPLLITTQPVVTVSSAGFNFWIIAVVLGIIFLIIVIFLIVCLMYRNRGGIYSVDKKEIAAGHDPEQELKNSGFHDLSRADGFEDEKPGMDRLSLTDSVKGYDTDDDDDLQEYGDVDVSKFNEDGSFIGLYSDNKGSAPSQSVV